MADIDRDTHDSRDYENAPGPPHEDHLNVRAISWFLVSLLFAAVIIHFGLYLFDVFKEREEARGKREPVRVNVDARRLPREPRLQPAPISDLQDLRRAEDEILRGYAWIDPDKGIVRMPIDRAIDLLSQRGLPAQGQPPTVSRDLPGKTPGGATVPAESGLGMAIQQPGGPLNVQGVQAAQPAAPPARSVSPGTPPATVTPRHSDVVGGKRQPK
jgi:hypothetical protein